MAQEQIPRWISEHLPQELADSTLFRFEVQVGKQKIIVDMLPDIDVDYNILEQQLGDVPAQYVYWASLYSELKTHVAIAERKIKARRGSLTEALADTAKKDSIRLTDTTIKAIVEKDETLNTLELRLALAQKHAGKLFHMLEAVKMKADSLRSLSGFKRQEMAQHGNL